MVKMQWPRRDKAGRYKSQRGWEIFKVEKESNRGRIDNSAREEEIHRGRKIPSVLQIRREIATSEGRDQDFNIEPRGTESTALSQSKKHTYYFRQPLREWNKKQRVSSDSHDAL